MNGLSDQAVAAPPALDLAARRSGFDEVFARIAGSYACLRAEHAAAGLAGNRGVRYVLAVPKSLAAATAADQMRADEPTQLVPASRWQQLSCGEGAKGPRFYDWTLIAALNRLETLK